MEGHLVEMVDDVLRDVLLGPRELVETGGDVGRQGLVTLGGGGHGRGPWHVRPPIRRRALGLLPRNLSAVMERLPTRLDGLVLLAPTVHGDERGFFLETYRQDAWARHGVPTALLQAKQRPARGRRRRGRPRH